MSIPIQKKSSSQLTPPTSASDWYSDSSFSSSSTSSEDSIERLRRNLGPQHPRVAAHLNRRGRNRCRGGGSEPLLNLNSRTLDCPDPAEALRCHEEALSILRWHRSHALLCSDDGHEAAGGDARRFATDIAATLADMGDALLEMKELAKAAEAYRECLELFVELEGKESADDSEADAAFVLSTIPFADEWIRMGYEDGDKKEVEATLHSHNHSLDLASHPPFRATVIGASRLLLEMSLVKFVSCNAGSSRRRRRKVRKAVERRNLERAASSLGFRDSIKQASDCGDSVASWEVLQDGHDGEDDDYDCSPHSVPGFGFFESQHGINSPRRSTFSHHPSKKTLGLLRKSPLVRAQSARAVLSGSNGRPAAIRRPSVFTRSCSEAAAEKYFCKEAMSPRLASLEEELREMMRQIPEAVSVLAEERGARKLYNCS